MPVITLTSDWIRNDFYLAAVKGQLLKLNENARIVDINHKISPHHIQQAAFVVRNAYKYFPDGSVHLIFVGAEPSEEQAYLAVKAKNHYFIAADNGIFSMILKDEKCDIVELKALEPEQFSSFPGLYTFTKNAVALLKNEELFSLGQKRNSFRESYPLRAVIDSDQIEGRIIYVDSYGNVVSNITREEFERVGKGKVFEIFVQSKHYTIREISQRYNTVPPGDLTALFNSTGLLEIAINQGNANRLLNLNFNSIIRVEFVR